MPRGGREGAFIRRSARARGILPLGSILDWYIFREFMGPFAFSTAGFSIILLSGLLFELTDLIFVKNVAAVTVIRMLLYRLPSLFVMTLPIAVLFSTLISLGRLSQDSELTVMRSCGASIRRLVMVVLVTGLLVSGLTYAANERVVPWANHRFENMLRQIIFEEGRPVVEENVFFRAGQERYFYIRRMDPSGELHDVLIYELPRQQGYPEFIHARTGTYDGDTWTLHQGVLRETDESGFTVQETSFDTMTLQTDDDADVYFGTQKTTDEMSRRELADHIERFQRGGLQVRSFVVDYHMKLAMPMASFMFALFGAPLALRSRGGRAFGIAVSIVVTFLYYVVSSVSRSLGVNAVLDPIAAAWLTNGVFGIIGVVLLTTADRLR